MGFGLMPRCSYKMAIFAHSAEENLDPAHGALADFFEQSLQPSESAINLRSEAQRSTVTPGRDAAMSEELTFSIGSDGDVTVQGYDELERWLANERAHWTWLARGDEVANRYNFATAVQDDWDTVLNSIASIRTQGMPLSEARPHLAPLATGRILISTTTEGATVLDILHSSGLGPAAFAAALFKKAVAVNNATSRDDFLGILLTMIPNLADVRDWSDHLKRERTNYRNATRSLKERLDKEAHKQTEANTRFVRRAAQMAKRIFNNRRAAWREAQEEWLVGANEQAGNVARQSYEAITSITATEASYREFMKLKAPVEYWEKKAKDHENREKTARKFLLSYFPLAILAMTGVFICAGSFLINHPDTETSKSPIALYVVVSGGLLLLSTMVFWIGRLLTKLYLSEHHLRNDAEERAVMTTTYLALTSEGAAADADRQIVLGALFRTTPDGIVKDDGPGDFNIQGLLARLAMK